MKAVLLAAAAVLAPAAAEAAPCIGPVCNFDTLAPYFARLEAAKHELGTPPVHILQIGDSHTAGDVTSAAWRQLLQAQAGDGGRGVLPPGRPYDGYLTIGVTTAMSPGWQVSSTFGKGWSAFHPPLGLSSYSLTSAVPGATMGLVTDTGHRFNRFVVCAIAGPTAGLLDVRMSDGSWQQLIFETPTQVPRCETIRTLAPQTSVTLAASDRPVTITSWATFDDEGGVALSNLGVVGSQLQHFGRTDDAVIAEELRAYAPALIVVAFGTNEGFGPSLDGESYETVLRAQIARLQRLAPGVPLLLLGPPDALSGNPALRSAPVLRVAGGGEVAGCPGAKSGGPPLFAPPALALVRAIQRKVAGDLDLAWWDWQQRMGGRCSAVRWTDATLMRADHVHFRNGGGALIARFLQDDLNRAAAER
ncbi:SGNH/GDSL hydrolase family protein [Sphingomonas sp.]|uniref:SGNH/GDSL hydrolase family protein n=1 Tax=Sphingomonas sp. TaxID=28214 RepID=UPI001B2B3715|nr:SGNH/GDSL hydrolase family protein [Sphingomonas sp.]MBO9713298.1 SGNH/GDSL hydrolase family protein [Sphingomonas sp.]